ncbi:WhiB family transcriptional regulator [Embleya hyalina]|uniref:Transcriptional regulator WhiB n=1 Tax=Embleya hyalina TaxID=516124 RepID=A0A401YQR2_9ACTN|nr:transcriptional regulator WhiB [Embleya hyalina]
MGLSLHDHIRRIGASIPCRTCDPEVFFDESARGIEKAKRVCRHCPLRRSCLTEALARNEPRGVWGGELLRDGEVIRPRGPRAVSR